MYKVAVVVPLFFAAVSAGIIAAPLAHGGFGYGHSLAFAAPAVAPVAVAHAAPLAVAHTAPVAVHAPVAVAAHAPVATSYANTYRVVHDSVPVVKSVAHTPVVAHPAPLAVAHGPVAVAAPAVAVGHGTALLSHGLHGYHH